MQWLTCAQRSYPNTSATIESLENCAGHGFLVFMALTLLFSGTCVFYQDLLYASGLWKQGYWCEQCVWGGVCGSRWSGSLHCCGWVSTALHTTANGHHSLFHLKVEFSISSDHTEKATPTSNHRTTDHVPKALWVCYNCDLTSGTAATMKNTTRLILESSMILQDPASVCRRDWPLKAIWQGPLISLFCLLSWQEDSSHLTIPTMTAPTSQTKDTGRVYSSSPC